MICGYRYRISPNKGEKVLLEKHIGSCRFVYNKLLHIKKVFYEKFKSTISEFKLNNHIVVLKNIYPVLKEINLNLYNKQVKILIQLITNSSKKERDFQKRRVKRIFFNHFKYPNITELKVKRYGFQK